MKHYRHTLAAMVLAFGAFIVSLTPDAHAVLMLSLDDGNGNAVTVTDDGVGDIYPNAGTVTYLGPVGSWFINATTGISKPIIGSADNPEMDLNSVNVSGGSGTLTIKLTDTDFISTDGVESFFSVIGGATNGTVTYESYIDYSQ